MKPSKSLAAATICIAALANLSMAGTAVAQAAAAPPAASPLPADPWPRDISLSTAAVLVYQPQVNSWTGNQIDFRVALAIKPTGATNETFGSAFATARTQVDKVARTVVFENLTITKSDFPTLPNHGAAYAAELQSRMAANLRSISLDRLEASMAIAGVKPPAVQVKNEVPQVIVSYSPAILVPVDGAPVFKAVPNDSRFQRVINTQALILKGGLGDQLYMHVYDGWLSAGSLSGPWTQSNRQPFGMDDAAQRLAKSGLVNMLDGGPNAKPKPSLANGVPTIFVSQSPTELIVFKGQPDFVPISGTQLLWAANTMADVFVDTSNNNYYALMAGRWFRTASLTAPWSFIASNALPADFARIPPSARAGAVLPTVAGTPQAQEALISNSIPQTATVPLKNGPKFTPTFDGPPQYVPVDGTTLSYMTNSSVPVIRVDADSYFAVTAGVWFKAPQLTGPWTVASAVPNAIYGIAPSSPIYYVTYVRIYEATPSVVYVGYTPGYMGTVVSPYGTVVYGTGYAYSPWVGSVWYPPPYTYGVAAAPVYNPAVGFTFGFAVGLATAAWMEPYWGYGGAYYHPAYWGGAYGCCGVASANVYGHWGSATYSGTRSWYAGGGVAGTDAHGTYYNSRTGTAGSYSGGKQYNAWTGNATRGYDRTAYGAAGGSGNVARGSNVNTYTGQRSTGSSVSAQGAGGSSYNRTSASTAGPQGDAHIGGGSSTNAATGKTNTWGTASVGNNHYADVNGNVYHNGSSVAGGGSSGWQQHSASGFGAASGDNAWADRESQARSAGDSRSSGFGGFSAAGGDRFGGGRFGGGGGFGGGRGFGRR